MPQDNQPQKQPAGRSMLFQALLLLDAFVLGGMSVVLFLNQFAEETQSRMNPWVPSDAFGVIPHMQDKLSVYWALYLGIALVLGLITLGVVITGSWRRLGALNSVAEQG